MTQFSQYNNLSVVTLIIPQARLSHCLSEILRVWQYDAIQFDCRGTVIGDHWFQALLPIMNPENEYLQFIVKDEEVDAFMAFCVDTNELHLPSSGAVYSTKCPELVSNTKTLYSRQDKAEQKPVQKQQIDNVKTNLFAVYALIQSDRTEHAIKAAIQAGSHGPIVYFVEGRGTRDRAGWLKITKKPYEEVVMVLVEDIDRENVMEALVTAGKVGTLGSGVVFDMPAGKGLINLPTSISNKHQRSSNEQITAALDQLMGNTDWRDHRSLISLLDKSNDKQTDSSAATERVLLNALIPRKYSNDFLDQILIIGIPGANVIYTKLFSTDDEDASKDVHIHHELVQIRMVVVKEDADRYLAEMQKFVVDKQYKEVTFYQQEIGEVVSYQTLSEKRGLATA